MDLVLVIIGGIALAIAVVAAVAIARIRSRNLRRRADRQAQSAAQLAELEQRAGAALVRIDERVRLADDELGFAIAEFGENTAADFAGALQRARQRLREAFQLNQQLSDHLPETDEQRRAFSERILTLCQSAEESLAEQATALAARRAAVRRTPAEIERLRSDIGQVRTALPAANATLARLAERYSEQALLPVASNPDQAEQLLDFAERSTQIAQTRLAASRDADATTALHAAAETVQRARALVDAVDGFEIDALRAEATLAAMVAESNSELAVARALPQAERRGRIDEAAASLEKALGQLPRAGAKLDPVGWLSVLRQANSALDDAVAERTQRAQDRERLRAQLITAIGDAEQQIAAARELTLDYRAAVGPDARTRLAEAEREFAAISDANDPETALVRARRAASLAAEAAGHARSDLVRGQGYGPGWHQPGPYPGPGYGSSGYGVGGSGILGGVLGGLAIGGLLDGMGDMGDFFGD